MATSETNHTQTTVQQMTRNIQSRDTRFHVHHGGAMSLSWLQFIAAWRRHAHTHTHTHRHTVMWHVGPPTTSARHAAVCNTSTSDLSDN